MPSLTLLYMYVYIYIYWCPQAPLMAELSRRRCFCCVCVVAVRMKLCKKKQNDDIE